MSMIEREIQNLEEIRDELNQNTEIDCDINNYAKGWAQDIDSAITTIKRLSEKVSKSVEQMQGERNTPKPPKETKNIFGPLMECPECGCIVMYNNTFAKYCPECGQKIRWGGQNAIL